MLESKTKDLDMFWGTFSASQSEVYVGPIDFNLGTMQSFTSKFPQSKLKSSPPKVLNFGLMLTFAFFQVQVQQNIQRSNSNLP